MLDYEQRECLRRHNPAEWPSVIWMVTEMQVRAWVLQINVLIEGVFIAKKWWMLAGAKIGYGM